MEPFFNYNGLINSLKIRYILRFKFYYILQIVIRSGFY